MISGPAHLHVSLTYRYLCAAAVLYTAGKELLGTPAEFKVFDLALDKLREDPRITLLIGSSITGDHLISLQASLYEIISYGRCPASQAHQQFTSSM